MIFRSTTPNELAMFFRIRRALRTVTLDEVVSSFNHRFPFLDALSIFRNDLATSSAGAFARKARKNIQNIRIIASLSAPARTAHKLTSRAKPNTNCPPQYRYHLFVAMTHLYASNPIRG
jgi:hypothetical protein